MPTLGFAIALAMLSACSPTGVAVQVERLEAPEALPFEDVVSNVSRVVVFEITNVGTADASIAVTAPEPFFVATPSVPVAAGATAEVRVGVRAPGFDPLVGDVTLAGPNFSTTIPVTVSFDTDADDDGFIDQAAGGSDCDDRSPFVSPASPEVCDLVDNDCDGLIDNNAVDVAFWYRDADGDTYGDPDDVVASCTQPLGYVARKGDCNDGDASVNPNAKETFYDGVDQDCDGRSDFDRDLDGYDASPQGPDCRDNNPNIHPGAPEIWYDGVDQDCDWQSDFDQDGDGHDIVGHAGGQDCDDTDPDVSPSAFEADNGSDDDCDLMIDESWLVRGDLLFTEVLVSPLARPNADGQYVELVNASARDIDLVGMSFRSSGGWATLPQSSLAPGEVALLCANTEPSVNGGLACDAALPALLGTADWVEIEAEEVLDEVDWTGWTVPMGAALELDGNGMDPDDNDWSGSWCTATQASGSGELGTPGVIDAPCEEE